MKRFVSTVMECIFFIAVMFLLFYMVACMVEVFWDKDGQRDAVPITSEFLITNAEGLHEMSTLPANYSVPDTEEMRAEGKLPRRIVEGDYLACYCSFQTVTFYINGQQRGVANGGDSIFRSDVPANQLYFIPLRAEDAGGELVMTYQSNLVDYKGYLGKLSVGTKVASARYQFRKRLSIVIVGMFVLFFGLILLGVGFSKEEFMRVNRVYKLLGFAGLFLGAWLILQSCIGQMFFDDISWSHWLELLSFAFLPVPLLLFMDECTHGMYWKYMQPICVVSLGFTISCVLLTLGGYDGMQFIILIHMLLGVATINAVAVLWDVAVRHKGLFRELLWVVVGFACFFICGLIEVLQFYFLPTQQEGRVLALGVGLFFICNFIWSQKQRMYYIVQEQKERQKARTKNLFLANMTHEIRTPVNTILLANVMIDKETGDPEIAQLSRDANREGRKLLSMINDILDYSKVVSHHMNVDDSNYDMVWFLRDVYRIGEKFCEEVPEVSFEFHCDPMLPSYLYGDEAKIRRILDVLLRKAFFHTKRGIVSLKVTDTLLQKEKVGLTFAISSDTYNGNPKRRLSPSDLFGNKQQSDKFEVEVNLVDELLNMMDGDIRVRVEDGKKTEVIVQIPQRVVESNPIGESNAASVEHAIILSRDVTRHILMVDDEEINHRIFQEILRGENISITDAYSGEEALELIQNHRYDYIFLDNQMDGLSGLETCEKMLHAEESRSNAAPVILMTAGSMEREEYVSYGFAGYIQKPMDRTNVFRMLKTMEGGDVDATT
ncbi:MAG: response regulator [Lachnospiraceae bacterium]|nr:response regulator [Lachnospiraceae bacterium]